MRRISDGNTYRSKHARYLLENVHVRQHWAGQRRSELFRWLAVVELLPDNIAKVRQKLVLLASMHGHLTQRAIILVHRQRQRNAGRGGGCEIRGWRGLRLSWLSGGGFVNGILEATQDDHVRIIRFDATLSVMLPGISKHGTISRVSARRWMTSARPFSRALVSIFRKAGETVGIDNDVVGSRIAGLGLPFSFFVRGQRSKWRELIVCVRRRSASP